MADGDKINTSSDQGYEWHLIGTVEDLKHRQCHKVYMSGGETLALFYIKPDKFYLTSATCPHARGPLDQGDIEEIDGALKVVCPMHYYSFDIATGESTTGLKLRTYKTDIQEGGVFAYLPGAVSLKRH